MAQVRNITDETWEVRVGGDVLAPAVEPDGLLNVPDELFDAVVWPPTVWAVEIPPMTPAPQAPATTSTDEE